MSELIDHSNLTAWALCWPADPNPLLYTSEARAEEDRRWFSKNFKNDNNGNPRGEPFVLRLEVAKLSPRVMRAIKAVYDREYAAEIEEARAKATESES